MSAPKHLWSGDWERDSELAAQERARRRGELEEPPGPEPAAPRRETMALRPEPVRPPQPARPARPRPQPYRPPRRSRPSRGAVLARTLARWRERLAKVPPPSQRAVLGGLIAFVAIVGVAIAISSLGSGSPASAGGPPPFLGAELESLPVNEVLVTATVPGSPADRAGLEPGDLITSVDHHSVMSPGDVTNAIAHLHAGDRVEIQFQRGPDTLQTQAVLSTQRSP